MLVSAGWLLAGVWFWPRIYHPLSTEANSREAGLAPPVHRAPSSAPLSLPLLFLALPLLLSPPPSPFLLPVLQQWGSLAAFGITWVA